MKRFYRILLRVYPAGFREEYGSELERQFSDEYRETNGWRDRARLGWRAVADLAATAPAELWRELRQDLRYAVRMYRQRAAATAIALTALALAIGATTGMFSVLSALLIRSLPFQEPERLVALSQSPAWPGMGRNAVESWRKESQYLEDAALYSSQPMNLGAGRGSFRVTVTETTANFLRVLGTYPELGRGFAADEDIPGRCLVAVIGYGLWQQAFGGDRGAVGSTIRLNGVALTIIGVAPPGFDFPEKTSVWTPTAYWQIPSLYWTTEAIGRLKPGLSLQQAGAMYAADAARVLKPIPGVANKPRLSPLRETLAGPVRPGLLVGMGMMAFVLLIACVNLAHLLLSRTTERRQELVTRAALGASRARLTRQLITEATALTAAAAIAGLVVARWTARLAASALPPRLASQGYAVLDWRVLAFALGLAVITGIVFGVLPSTLIGRMQPGVDVLRARGTTAGKTRGVLIAVQAALTVTLAAGAFSMGFSFLRLLGTDLGFGTNRVATLSVSFAGVDDARGGRFCRDALERLRAVPGVESAGATAYLPLVEAKMYEGTYFRLESGEPEASCRVMSVSPGYFRTVGTPLVAGREFTDGDRKGAAPVVIVNEAFARGFRDRRLVGRRMYLQPARLWATVVGVVRTQRFLGPEAEAWPAIYRPLDQYGQFGATFVVKTRGAPEQYLPVLRDVAQGTDRLVPVYDVKTLDRRLADTLARPRFYTTAIVFLAVFALLVAGVGTYGAAAHAVAQRTHEIGIRLAVGGAPGQVRGMVFRESMVPVCAGVALGLCGATALGRFLHHLLASSEPAGVRLCASAAAVVLAATAGAIWSATRRVVGTDPTAALRAD